MVGTLVSHYRIDAELGRGGMGIVFRAYDTHLRRPVALKMLTGRITSRGHEGPAVLAEARVASALNHPAIITIYEVGEHKGQHFIVMQLLSGENLRSTIEKGPVELRTVFRIGAQVAEALHAAHSEGVVHGDVKPENVMILPNGRLKLLDFGIARRYNQSTNTMTLKSGMAQGHDGWAGTPAYTAPEALQCSRVDLRADLYSLGVVLFELVSGRRPFHAVSLNALVEQILHQPVPDLRLSTDSHTAAIGEVVKRLSCKRSRGKISVGARSTG